MEEYADTICCERHIWKSFKECSKPLHAISFQKNIKCWMVIGDEYNHGNYDDDDDDDDDDGDNDDDDDINEHDDDAQ